MKLSRYAYYSWRATRSRSTDFLVATLPLLPLLSAQAPYRWAGLYAITGVAAALGIALFQRRTFDLLAPAMLLVGMLLLGAYFSGISNRQALHQVAQLLMIAGVLLVAPQLRASPAAHLASIIFCTAVAALAWSDLSFMSGEIFGNRNLAGAAAACCSCVALKIALGDRRRFIVVLSVVPILLALLVLLVSQSRASVLLMAAPIALICFPWPRALRQFRATTAVAVLAVVALTPWLVYQPSLAHTNTERAPIAATAVGPAPATPQPSPPSTRGIFNLSSREIIWATITFEIGQNGYHGRGLGRLPSEVLSGRFSGLSAHNGFIQLLYQFGALGLLLYCSACILVIHHLAQRPLLDPGLGIFVGAMMHEVFEVTLTQNNFGVGLLLWLAALMPLQGASDTRRFRTHGRAA